MTNKLQHIAFIMDGNRRWATERGLPKLKGHSEGSKALKSIAKAVKKRGLTHATFWALSTENLKRPERELTHLFRLIEKIPEELDELIQENIRLNIIGNLNLLPKKTAAVLRDAQEDTKDNDTFTLTLAIGYGGRDEITRAVQRIIDNGLGGDEISEELIAEHLDTADLPDPDLIIRTGGNTRLSGYLPWQSTYAELYFTDTKWPAFAEKDLDDAIDWFEGQKRNFGK